MGKEGIHYGSKLRELVKTSGTQKEIAEKMGKSQSTLAECFNSEDPHVSTVRDICAACGIKAWHFIAYVETGIPAKAWSNFERIMNLEETDKNFVLEGINNSLRFIIEKNKKAVD